MKHAFDPENPFPLLPYGSYTYTEAKAHAEAADAFLGYEIETCEAKVQSPGPDQQNWKSLPAQSMQTPYLEIRSILEILLLSSNDLVVDFGCAYGRIAHVMKRHYSAQKFMGFEIESIRVQEAKRTLGSSSNIEIHCQDISKSDWTPPLAQVYFIYDFGSLQEQRKLLEKLRPFATKIKFKLVARGRGIRHLIQSENPWLCEVEDPQHFDHFSIYSNRS